MSEGFKHNFDTRRRKNETTATSTKWTRYASRLFDYEPTRTARKKAQVLGVGYKFRTLYGVSVWVRQCLTKDSSIFKIVSTYFDVGGVGQIFVVLRMKIVFSVSKIGKQTSYN